MSGNDKLIVDGRYVDLIDVGKKVRLEILVTSDMSRYFFYHDPLVVSRISLTRGYAVV